MLTLLAGLVAGILHVFTGPDHLATVGTLAVEERRRSWVTGLIWGVGHTSGVWIVGALVLVLRGLLPLEQMSSYSDRLASMGLIAIGLWGLYKGLAHKIHAHEHEHEGKLHIHHHAHGLGGQGEHVHPHIHTHLACGLGILHGLAGSSHFLGVLPALALPSNALALVYLGGFGLGTIAAMAGFGWVMGGLAQRLAGVGLQAHRLLVTGCAAAAIVIGGVWLAEAGPSPWLAMGIVVVLAYGISWLVARPLLYRNKSAAVVDGAAEMVPASARSLLQAGPLVLDPVGHQVQVEGRRLELTTTEFKLLIYLVEHPGQVLSRDDLLRSVWGYTTTGYSRTVDTHVQRLREKLGQASGLIETVRGAGYRFRAGDG